MQQAAPSHANRVPLLWNLPAAKDATALSGVPVGHPPSRDTPGYRTASRPADTRGQPPALAPRARHRLARGHGQWVPQRATRQTAAHAAMQKPHRLPGTDRPVSAVQPRAAAFPLRSLRHLFRIDAGTRSRSPCRQSIAPCRRGRSSSFVLSRMGRRIRRPEST